MSWSGPIERRIPGPAAREPAKIRYHFSLKCTIIMVMTRLCKRPHRAGRREAKIPRGLKQCRHGDVDPLAAGEPQVWRLVMKRGITVAGTKRTRKVCYLSLMLVMAGLGGSTTMALDPMGPPASALRRGDYKVTLDYAFGQMDLDLAQGRWTERLDGAPYNAGPANSITIEDFEAHRVYAGLGYGIFENWDVFVRLGGANATFGDSIWEAGEDFEGDNDLAVGAGIKATFYTTDRLRFGGLLQGSYAAYDGKLDASGWPSSDFIEATISEAQLALGATYLWTQRVSVYAGPFVHYMMGDFEDTFTVYNDDLNGLINTIFSWEIDNGLAYGGYLGAQIVLGRNCLFNVEYQQTSDANTIGMGLMWRI